VTKTPARFIDFACTPDAQAAEKQVAKEHEISDTLRNQFGGDPRRSVTFVTWRPVKGARAEVYFPHRIFSRKRLCLRRDFKSRTR
jgi:hypothetical protein